MKWVLKFALIPHTRTHTVLGVLCALLLILCVTTFASASETTTISGRLVSSSGDPIKLTGTCGKVALGEKKAGTFFYDFAEAPVNADGTFSITAPATSGEYILRYTTDVENSINVIPGKSFFYAPDSGSAVNVATKAAFLNLADGSVSGLELVVETGWTLSGTVRLGEGAVLTNSRPGNASIAWIWFGFRSSGANRLDVYQEGINFYRGESEWSYRIIMPKTPVTYTLMVDQVKIYNGTESNIYTGELDIAEVAVNGDMTLPDIVLNPARAEVTADFALDTRFLYTADVYLATDSAVYQWDLDAHYVSSYSVPLTIPAEDTSETYRIYYKFKYDGSGGLITGPVYVAADGSLTTDAGKAGNFPIQDTAYSIDPLKMPPFAEGRIYIPNYMGEIFYITVGARSGNTTYRKSTITVSQATAQLDETQGRYYVPYSLASNEVKDGTTYYLYFTVSYDKGDNGRWVTRQLYADQDGGPLVGWSDRFTFTVDEEKANEVDVRLLMWNNEEEYMFVQNEHGLTLVQQNSASYSASCPGAESLKVTFSFLTDVYLKVNGTEYSDSKLAGKTIEVTGDTLIIESVGKTSSVKEQLYGFAVEKIEPIYPGGGAAPDGVVAVYGTSGSTEETILADLAAGNALRVSLIHAEDVGDSTVAAAVYDDKGCFVDMVLADLIYGNGLGTAQLDFAPCAEAAELRVMLLAPESCVPQMSLWSLK